MEIVRNFINVAGLADENSLPANINGQIIEYSENDTIFIPNTQPEVKNIFQIMIKVEINNSRRIKTPTGYTVVLDGIKKLKIVYTQNGDSSKANFLDMNLPYNCYVELPQHIKLDSINIYVLDAYFDMLDSRKIYSHILYLVNVMAQGESTGMMDSTQSTVNISNVTMPKHMLEQRNLLPATTEQIEENYFDGLLTYNDTNERQIEKDDANASPIDLDAEYL